MPPVDPANPSAALGQMTVVQKLQLMEAIWDDLCRQAQDLPSPDWHGQVLEDRQKRASQGTAAFSDWNQAKRRIRDAAT